jgi:hypothetical protein
MAGNAQRDAKLSLKFDTSEATRGLSELEKATEEYARREKELQAEIQKTTEVLEKRVQARLGKLSADQASAAVEALRKIKEAGIESASPDDVKAARRLAPEVVRQEQERLGRQSPAYQQLAGMGMVGDSRQSQVSKTYQEKFESEKASALAQAQVKDQERREREAERQASRQQAEAERQERRESERQRRQEEKEARRQQVEAERQSKREEATAAKAERRTKQKEARYQKFSQAFADEQDVLNISAAKEESAKRAKAQEDAQKEANAMQTAEARRKAQEATQGGQRFHGAAGFINAASSGNIAGMMGAAGPAVLAAAAIGAFVKSIDLATVAVNTLRNADLTSAQKLNIIGDELTFGFTKKLRDLSNALDGTTERMRRAGIRAEETRARTNAEMQHLDRRIPVEAERGTQFGRQRIFGQASAVPMGAFNRDTMSGEIGYQEALQRQGARDTLAQASREAEVARAAVASNRGVLATVTADHDTQRAIRFGAQQRHDNLIRQENGRGPGDVVILPGQDVPAGQQRPGGPPGARQQGARDEAGLDLQEQLERESQLFDRMVRQREAVRNAGVEAANAEMRARQANIGVMQTELQILQQREQRMIGDASRLGGMNFIDRRMGLNAARQVRDQGIGNVTPQVREMAQRFAPEWFQQQARQFGENTPEFRAGRQEGFLEPGNQGIADNRAEQGRIMQQLREEQIAMQRDNARAIGDILERGLREMVDEFERRMALIALKQRTGLQIRQNQQG